MTTPSQEKLIERLDPKAAERARLMGYTLKIYGDDTTDKIITAYLSELLALRPAVGEPVCWRIFTGEEGTGWTIETERWHAEQAIKDGAKVQPLYASPPTVETAPVADGTPSHSFSGYMPEQLAKLAFVAFYSSNLCAPQNIKGVVDEVDTCGGTCEHVSGSTCYKQERGDYCPWSLAEDLRNISLALYGPTDPSGYRAAVWGPPASPIQGMGPGGASKTVPVEPTHEMGIAGFHLYGAIKNKPFFDQCVAIYRAMLAAAPLQGGKP